MTVLFQDEATITELGPGADECEVGSQCIWVGPEDLNSVGDGYHMWVCVPNDREGMVEGEEPMWIEIHSIESDFELSEHPSQHEKFKQMYGKKVRVTVEILD